ncbi:ParB-like protein [Caballeronia sp. RCC_10]|uniref:ParB-like protein n=1 Tax=Caballeronia sp. RCC_10 TaxID=3239227 RepID=UPI0035262370
MSFHPALRRSRVHRQDRKRRCGRPQQPNPWPTEVRQKAEAYAKLEGHELGMAIADKPVPIVYGPGGVPFAIDHRHVAAALWRAHVKRVP